jgi:hypothetical protein
MTADSSPHPSQFPLWDVFPGIPCDAGLSVRELVAEIEVGAVFHAPRTSALRLPAPDSLTHYVDSVTIIRGTLR